MNDHESRNIPAPRWGGWSCLAGWTLVCVATLGLCGCDSRPATYEAAPAPAAGAWAGVNEETLRQLTAAYRAFCRTNKSRPATFPEFAAAARVRMPMTPPGFALALNTNSLEVVLVRR